MKELITTLTIGVLSLSLLTMLIPSKEKTLKFLVSVVLLSMVALPVIKAIPTLKNESIELPETNSYENVLSLKTKTTELLIESILKENGIEFKKVTVFANISKDYSITIKSVEILTNENKEKVLKALQELDFEKVVRQYEG